MDGIGEAMNVGTTGQILCGGRVLVKNGKHLVLEGL
jgi:hypothetical protein